MKTALHDQEIVRLAKHHISPGEIEMLEKSGLLAIEREVEGAYFKDAEGKRFLDCRNDAGSFNVGRRNPAVIAAVKESLGKHDIGDNFFLSEPKVELARKLGKLSPEGALDCCTFGVSGGEIIDFAIKAARGFTGRSQIVAAKAGYHGVTGFSLAATGEKAYKRPFKPMAKGFKHVPFGDSQALKRAVGRRTAAVLLEPVQGEGGVHVPSEEYLRNAREICDEAGALLILDEIQTGFGRTGRMFCVEYSGIVPDIMTLGKSLSGGIYPITAAIYRREIQRYLAKHPFTHLSTFGGSDIACVAALAAIRELESRDLAGNAARMGALILEALKELQRKHPKLVREARGLGLELGVEMKSGSLGRRFSAELYDRGVMAPYGVHNPAIIRILPSLVIGESDARFLIDAVGSSLLAMDSLGWLARWTA